MTSKLMYHYGKGGRSSVTGIVATVFGATGFSGRYVVNALARLGAQVIVPFRGDDTVWRHLKLMGDLGQIVPFKCSLDDPLNVLSACSRSNVIVNLLNLRNSTRNYTVDDVNHQAARMIANVAKEVKAERLIHVSAMGAHFDSPSDWARSKFHGEEAVREVDPSATIIRPAQLYGEEDNYLNKFARFIRFFRLIPLVRPQFKDHPLWVNDFAAGLIECLIDEQTKGKTFEFYGPDKLTQRQVVELILDETLYSQTRTIVEVNDWIGQIMADVLQFSRRPFLTPDDFAFMLRDVVPSKGALDLTSLGLQPKRFCDVGLRYLRSYRAPSLHNILTPHQLKVIGS